MGDPLLLLCIAHLAACPGCQGSSKASLKVSEALLQQAPPFIGASGGRRSAALFEDTSPGWY